VFQTSLSFSSNILTGDVRGAQTKVKKGKKDEYDKHASQTKETTTTI
jgi:hypothetical protein